MKTLIIFGKAPVPGFVKTRLASSTCLSEEQVCSVYEAFLKDIVSVAALTSAETILISYTPDGEEKRLRDLIRGQNLGTRNERRFVFTPQTGETYAERVANAFSAAAKFEGEAVVMIRTDAPVLKPEIIDGAFEFIISRSGVTLGPSGAGSVYLIGHPGGMALDFSRVFTEGSEIENLLGQARGGNMPLKLLPEILDVTLEGELITLIGVMRALAYQRKFESQVFPMSTFKVIEDLGLEIVRSGEDGSIKQIAFSKSVPAS
ncbi:MAG: DUF2064 domain-containing protein [Nitrospinae bacterium]|nr:DUF2064 domain-containing protein [Nitrospinota bacterium]